MNQTRVSGQTLSQRNAPLPITAGGQRTPTAPCPKYKNMYRGECLFNFTRVCYSYGQEGHIAKFCKGTPTKPAKPTSNVRPNTRVYSLNENAIEAGPSTSITGQIIVSNLNLYALIDSGGTHSFIVSRLMDRLEGKRKLMTTPFIIKTPTREMYQSLT